MSISEVTHFCSTSNAFCLPALMGSSQIWYGQIGDLRKTIYFSRNSTIQLCGTSWDQPVFTKLVALVNLGWSQLVPHSRIAVFKMKLIRFRRLHFFLPTIHIFRHWFLSEPGLVSTGTSKLNRSISTEIDVFAKVAFWSIAKSIYFQDPRNGPNVPPETIVKSPWRTNRP